MSDCGEATGGRGPHRTLSTFTGQLDFFKKSFPKARCTQLSWPADGGRLVTFQYRSNARDGSIENRWQQVCVWQFLPSPYGGDYNQRQMHVQTVDTKRRRICGDNPILKVSQIQLVHILAGVVPFAAHARSQ